MARAEQRIEVAMLWALVALVLIFWLVGLTAHIAGGLIHLLLVVALVLVIFNLVTGRRSV
ncbi:MAG: lmo0937 family membrane protein [Chloroflexota bacterium]